MQETCNSITNALELRLSCTNPLIYSFSFTKGQDTEVRHGILADQIAGMSTKNVYVITYSESMFLPYQKVQSLMQRMK